MAWWGFTLKSPFTVAPFFSAHYLELTMLFKWFSCLCWGGEHGGENGWVDRALKAIFNSYKKFPWGTGGISRMEILELGRAHFKEPVPYCYRHGNWAQRMLQDVSSDMESVSGHSGTWFWCSFEAPAKAHFSSLLPFKRCHCHGPHFTMRNNKAPSSVLTLCGKACGPGPWLSCSPQ